MTDFMRLRLGSPVEVSSRDIVIRQRRWREFAVALRVFPVGIGKGELSSEVPYISAVVLRFSVHRKTTTVNHFLYFILFR